MKFCLFHCFSYASQLVWLNADESFSIGGIEVPRYEFETFQLENCEQFHMIFRLLEVAEAFAQEKKLRKIKLWNESWTGVLITMEEADDQSESVTVASLRSSCVVFIEQVQDYFKLSQNKENWEKAEKSKSAKKNQTNELLIAVMSGEHTEPLSKALSDWDEGTKKKLKGKTKLIEKEIKESQEEEEEWSILTQVKGVGTRICVRINKAREEERQRTESEQEEILLNKENQLVTQKVPTSKLTKAVKSSLIKKAKEKTSKQSNESQLIEVFDPFEEQNAETKSQKKQKKMEIKTDKRKEQKTEENRRRGGGRSPLYESEKEQANGEFKHGSSPQLLKLHSQDGSPYLALIQPSEQQGMSDDEYVLEEKLAQVIRESGSQSP